MEKRENPFPFKECLLTDDILTFIGFCEYNSGCGDFGDRRLDLGGHVGDKRLRDKGEYPSYLIYEFDAQSGNDWGYGLEPRVPEHYADKDMVAFYFLHEMYEDIVKRRTLEELGNFVARLKRPGTDLYPYLESYLKYKHKND